MSYNRWQYVYSNPINLTDPTGFIPGVCQSMPNKTTYAICVMELYRIQPINPFDLDRSVQGEKGCYSGPTEYRAPGYIEGRGWLFTSFWYIGFHEMVYDFASMQRTDFDAKGYGLHDMSVGLSYSQYVGIVYGLMSNSDVITDYRGPFVVGNIGIGVGTADGIEVGLGISGGKSGFISTQDPMIYGKAWYIGGSLGVDGIPLIDAGVGYLDYTPTSNSIEDYAPDKKHVSRKQELINDILNDQHNVWTIPTGPIEATAKMYGAALAVWYAKVYEELHNANQ
jgi:hypothetical protein